MLVSRATNFIIIIICIECHALITSNFTVLPSPLHHTTPHLSRSRRLFHALRSTIDSWQRVFRTVASLSLRSKIVDRFNALTVCILLSICVISRVLCDATLHHPYERTDHIYIVYEQYTRVYRICFSGLYQQNKIYGHTEDCIHGSMHRRHTARQCDGCCMEPHALLQSAKHEAWSDTTKAN